MEFLEVVGGVGDLEWFVSKPVNTLDNMINEFVIFLAWVGVVETEISLSTILFSNCEVESNSLSMTDMKITIWFRWESGHHLTFSESGVCFDDLL